MIVAFSNGQIAICQEGDTRKFVSDVEHRTFSGTESLRRGQRVLYITERCVFQLVPDPENGGSALELIEIAPGIDLQQDVLAHMDFVPRIANPLKMMDARLFQDEPMQLQSWLLDQQVGDYPTIR